MAGLRVAVPAVDLDIHEVGPPHGPHLHLDVRYLVVAPPGAVPVGNHESLDLRWAAYDELPSYGVDEGLLRLARAAPPRGGRCAPDRSCRASAGRARTGGAVRRRWG